MVKSSGIDSVCFYRRRLHYERTGGLLSVLLLPEVLIWMDATSVDVV